MTAQPMTNVKKIAALLISMGPEQAAQVLTHLEPSQVASLAQEIAALGHISNQTRRTVIREFRALLARKERERVGMAFAEQVLEKALGPQQSQTILQHLTPSPTPATPPLLTTMTPARAAELIAGEPVPLIALMLASLSPEQAALVLKALPPERQPQVALQLTKTSLPTPEIRAHLEKALRAKANQQMRDEQQKGRALLAQLLPGESNVPQPFDGSAAINSSAVPMPALTFAELDDLDLTVLQNVVRRLPLRELCVALRGADQPLLQRVLQALPSGCREAVQEYLAQPPAVKLSEIVAAQQHVAHQATAVLREGTAGKERCYV